MGDVKTLVSYSVHTFGIYMKFECGERIVPYSAITQIIKGYNDVMVSILLISNTTLTIKLHHKESTFILDLMSKIDSYLESQNQIVGA